MDTNLWNVSFEQQIDPRNLLPSLDQYGATPVLGIHVVFELIKTFFSKSADATNLARSLLRHVESYFDAGLRTVAKDPIECIVAEMYAVKGPVGAEKFLSRENLENFTAEIKRLATGIVKEEWKTHVRDQIASTEADRKRFAEHLSVNTELRHRLRGVSPEDLREWLKAQTYSIDGQRLLFEQLAARFPEQNSDELREYSTALLTSCSRMSEALVRAELYYNWRCAHRSSNRKDLLDDMYHVCNAAYCDVYSSSEKNQTEYASHLLQNDTQIHVYDQNQALDAWLCSIARRNRSD
jgi:hypothetical protein